MAPSRTWKELYEAALVQSDVANLCQHVEYARSAIMARVDELVDDPNRKPEHDEILSALSKLNRLASASRRVVQPRYGETSRLSGLARYPFRLR